jgi:hypothetical protein
MKIESLQFAAGNRLFCREQFVCANCQQQKYLEGKSDAKRREAQNIAVVKQI